MMSENIKLLKKAMQWCKEQPSWPKNKDPWGDGYSMLLDAETENIIVLGPFMAFCITSHAVREDLHKEQFEACITRLVEIHEKFAYYKELRDYVMTGENTKVFNNG